MKQDTSRSLLVNTLEEVWPEGVPAAELALCSLLGDDDRALAALRIQELVKYEAEGDWAARAAEMGLSKPGFFSLLRRWRRSRSIETVVTRLGGKPGRAVGQSFTKDARGEIARVVASHFDEPRQKIIEAVRARLASPPAASSLRRLVDEALVDLGRQRLGARGEFGRNLLIASCPLELRLGGGQEHTAMAFGAFVLDLATGHTLGHAVDDSSIGACRLAAGNAADWTHSAQVSEDANGTSDITVHVAGNAIETLRELRRLGELPLPLTLMPDDGRRHVSLIVQQLGKKLGKLVLRPRAEVRAATTADEDVRRQEGRMSSTQIVSARLDVEIGTRDRTLGDRPALAVPASVLETSLRLISGRG